MIQDPIAACRFWLHDPDGVLFTDPQVQEFLDLEKRIDADGYPPTSSHWTPTYDVVSAAGRAFIWKAGQVANKPISYRMGDVWIMVDKNYCWDRARELLGPQSGALQRRDEQEDPDVLDRYRTDR